MPVGTTFTYRVRFQNLGPAPTIRVLVNDRLDPALDPSTLEVLSTSHPVSDFKILNQQIIWTFDINLPPASSNELESRGEIVYRIRPKASAGVGTTILNSAAIYFDLNDPVITATTTNTITADPAPVAAFTVTPQLGTEGYMNDFAYTGGTAGATFLWDFGPDALPQTSTQQNPTGVFFIHPGPRLVSLRTSLGACESQPAVRVVTAGLTNLEIEAGSPGPVLFWDGDGYRVQQTDDLVNPSWQPAPGTATNLGGQYFLQLPAPGVATRFYRLEL